MDTWRAIVDRVRVTHAPLASVLEHAMPLEISGAHVRLGYGPKATFLADQAKEPENLELLTREVRAHFGAPTEVALDLSANASVQTIASIEAEKKKAATAAARAEVANHPLVEEAVRIFGAELREIKLPHADD